MPRFEIIAGLDVGTTKVCMAVVKRQVGLARGESLGCYKVECAGLCGGNVVDLPSLADAIAAVLRESQDKTRHKISTAFVNIAGTHIVADNVRGRINLLDKEDEISRKDVAAVYNNAKLSAVTYDREPVLVVPQNYIVDGQATVKNPVGLFGSRLDVDYLFITGSTPVIESLSKAVNLGGLEIEELVLSNLASSFSALSQSERDLGVALVDIGGSVTEVTLFTEGIIRHDKMLSQGAGLLVNAISSDLKLQPDAAAKVLKNYCKVSSPVSQKADEHILINHVVPPKTVTAGHLQKIIEPKTKEILNSIKDAIDSSNYSSAVTCGVVLIGGISTMDGLAELAETVFNMPVRVSSHLSCVTAMGLAEYGCLKRVHPGMVRQFGGNMFKRAFEAARDFIYDYF